jgi:hypothetical protein
MLPLPAELVRPYATLLREQRIAIEKPRRLANFVALFTPAGNNILPFKS